MSPEDVVIVVVVVVGVGVFVVVESARVEENMVGNYYDGRLLLYKRIETGKYCGPPDVVRKLCVAVRLITGWFQ